MNSESPEAHRLRVEVGWFPKAKLEYFFYKIEWYENNISKDKYPIHSLLNGCPICTCTSKQQMPTVLGKRTRDTSKQGHNKWWEPPSGLLHVSYNSSSCFFLYNFFLTCFCFCFLFYFIMSLKEIKIFGNLKNMSIGRLQLNFFFHEVNILIYSFIHSTTLREIF